MNTKNIAVQLIIMAPQWCHSCRLKHLEQITSFMVLELGRPEGEAQLLAGAYWGCITIGRSPGLHAARIDP
jgi:hypothetical protein